jgi:hypothetical protein
VGPISLWAELLPADYFPLAVGNRWVYESSEGTEALPALESWEIVRQEEGRFVLRVQQPYATTESFEETVTPSADGISSLSREKGKGGAQKRAPGFFLKAPLKAGSNWKNADGRYAITAVDEMVTVPAGTFTNCVEVTRWSTAGTATVISLYAPGVGMVQREERFQIIGGIGGFDAPQQGRAVLRLKEWTINGPGSRVSGRESEIQRRE